MSSPMMALPSKSTIRTISPDPLLRSAPRPRIPRVAALIAGVSRPNKSLITAAMQNNSSKLCDILNDQKKAVWLDKKSLDWALPVVARQGHEQTVRLLLEKGADANTRGDWSDTALGGASRNGHEPIVRLLLEKGADVNARGGDSALGCASRNGHEQIVRLLLKKGADVNVRGAYCEFPLVAASQYGHEEIVRLLLEKGADVNARGEHLDSDSALGWASRNGHEQIVRLLLEKGADVNVRGVFCEFPLVAATQNGHEQIVRLLLQNGADVNTRGRSINSDRDTALVIASRNGDHNIVRLLLEKGADVERRGKLGQTALEAARYHFQEVVHLLLAYGAEDKRKIRRVHSSGRHQAAVVEKAR